MEQVPLQLIKDCLKGNRIAQHELYQLYAAKMLGICYRYTKSLEDAEDVLQEGFIKVFTRLGQYKQNGNLGAWIRMIMVNTAIDYINKHNRYKNSLQLEDVQLYLVSDDDPNVLLDTKDLVELIRALPITYQLVFNLVAIEGMNHPEVAELLQMNINTIRSNYSRARAMLIGALEKEQTQTDTSEQMVYYAKKI